MISMTKSAAAKTQEKRRGARVSLGCHAAIYDESSPGKSPIQKMIISNVSESGLCLEGTGELSVGATYPMEFLLPSGSEVSAVAQIVWKHPDPHLQSYGARFTHVSWWQRRRLREYIRFSLGEHNLQQGLWKLAIGAAVLGFGLKTFISLMALAGWPTVVMGAVMVSLYMSFMRTPS